MQKQNSWLQFELKHTVPTFHTDNGYASCASILLRLPLFYFTFSVEHNFIIDEPMLTLNYYYYYL